jgi:hypothetical protein
MFLARCSWVHTLRSCQLVASLYIHEKTHSCCQHTVDSSAIWSARDILTSYQLKRYSYDGNSVSTWFNIFMRKKSREYLVRLYRLVLSPVDLRPQWQWVEVSPVCWICDFKSHYYTVLCYVSLIMAMKCSKSISYGTEFGRCENPECRNITEYGGISRNMAE